MRLEKNGQTIAYLDVLPTQKLSQFRFINNSIKTYVIKTNPAATNVYTWYRRFAYTNYYYVIDMHRQNLKVAPVQWSNTSCSEVWAPKLYTGCAWVQDANEWWLLFYFNERMG
jgi:hypothetical protein